MSTWLGCIVETRGRADFWDVARRRGIEPRVATVPARALVSCEIDFEAPLRLAAELSRDLEAFALGFVVQTNADVHRLHAFDRGELVRKLDYSRDGGGWVADDGAKQPWEARYFFDDAPTTEADEWPDMLHDDLSDDDVARYERARAAGDPRPVMDLFHPSSARAMRRVCQFFGVDADAPVGLWKKPSLWSRLTGAR